MIPLVVRKVSLVAIIALLVVSALTRLVSAGLASMPPSEADFPIASDAFLCPPSEEVSVLISEIGAKDRALSEREAAVAMRERDIEMARQEVSGSLDRLAEAEARLAARMEQSATASAADVARLVEVYEGMKPKEAAVLFEAMDPAFAAGFMARMTPDAASALLSNLSADRAYALSVIMAGRNANAATE